VVLDLAPHRELFDHEHLPSLGGANPEAAAGGQQTAASRPLLSQPGQKVVERDFAFGHLGHQRGGGYLDLLLSGD
jgi:hypothetical protein